MPIVFRHLTLTSLVAQSVKHLPMMWETQVWSLGQEDLLEKEMAIHSWKIPWTEEPGRLQSMGLQRVGLSDFTFTFNLHATLGDGIIYFISHKSNLRFRNIKKLTVCQTKRVAELSNAKFCAE